ncbi:rod shape-determining protein MreC [Patescibacteria group bacterium]|nr:rod shape-determining protein MreC [Patescibacteria group bacterium]
MLLSNKSSKLILIALIVICLLIFLHVIKVLSPLENIVTGASKSIFISIYRISNELGSVYLNYDSRQKLLKENQELRDNIIDLSREKSVCSTEKEENEFLRKQLNFLEENDCDYQLANVIGKNIDNTQNAIIVDKGEKHGVKLTQPVITDKGVLIGKIVKVRANSSIVLLINDDLSKVAAKIQNQTATGGIVEGEYGLGIKMKLIPKTEKIIEGDIVVTSGLEKYTPAELIIGQVERITNEPEELFQEASIKSFIEFDKITFVNIVKKKNVD